MKKTTKILKISQIICSGIYMVLPFVPLYRNIRTGFSSDSATVTKGFFYYSAYDNLDAYISSNVGKILLIAVLEALFISTIVFLILELKKKKEKISNKLFCVSTFAIAALLFACMLVTRA